VGLPLKIKDEGVTLIHNTNSLDFKGDGVSGSLDGMGGAEEEIPGGGGGDQTGILGWDIGNGEDAINVGIAGRVQASYNGTITGWRLNSGNTVSGSIVIDVRETTSENTIPTGADSIAGSEKPTLVTQSSNSDMNLTTWTLTVTKGRWYWFYVESNDGLRQVVLSIEYNKS